MKPFPTITLLATVGLVLVIQTSAYSLTQVQYDKLIQKSCFERSKTTGQEKILGQNKPIGLSIENLISLIEKFERLNSNVEPQYILKYLLQRFHIDGLKFNGKDNIQSGIEYHHSILTNVILSGEDLNSEPINFPENQFSEDEKCNLFFTISHIVNETALEHEDESNTHLSPMHDTARAPTRDMGQEVPIGNKEATKSDFLSADIKTESAIKSKRSINYTKQIRLTKTPREYGIASFLSSNTNPIAVNRLLLGMLVGFSETKPKKLSQILDVLKQKLPTEYEDFLLDPLYAVTLGDLYGIDLQDMSISPNKIIFGADGEWKSTVCHTDFILKKPGYWGTVAEFRGGLDGFNIGVKLSDMRKIYPKLTASQALRFYYSKPGLESSIGICQRDYFINQKINMELKDEANKYLVLWNTYFHSNQFDKERLENYIDQIKEHFFETLNKASILNQDENTLCSVTLADNIQSKPCESNTDIFLLLDITQKCSPKKECDQAVYVNNIVKNLNLARGKGSVSVLFNAGGNENADLVDDQMNRVSTKLYSTAYNSTSIECASCRAWDYDSGASEAINNRVKLMELINMTLSDFGEIRANDSGVPAKLFFWFDFQTLGPIPNDKIQKLKYEQIKNTLKYIHRDVSFFGLAKNVISLNDTVLNNAHLVPIGSDQLSTVSKIKDMSKNFCEVPSVFQYNDCNLKSSNNYTHVGYLSSGRKQFWAMYPEYFLKSYQIQLKFRAENASIQVCYGRVTNPEKAKENCKIANSINGEVSWVVSNPCKGYTYSNCPPFYFTITTDNKNLPICTDAACQNINQVKWYFSHFGISCNRTTSLTISSFLLITSFLFTTIVYKKFL